MKWSWIAYLFYCFSIGVNAGFGFFIGSGINWFAAGFSAALLFADVWTTNR